MPSGSWRKFIISSTVPFVGGLIFILGWRLFSKLHVIIYKASRRIDMHNVSLKCEFLYTVKIPSYQYLFTMIFIIMIVSVCHVKSN